MKCGCDCSQLSKHVYQRLSVDLRFKIKVKNSAVFFLLYKMALLCSVNLKSVGHFNPHDIQLKYMWSP